MAGNFERRCPTVLREGYEGMHLLATYLDKVLRLRGVHTDHFSLVFSPTLRWLERLARRHR
jgi:hypothetical protein